MSEIQSIKIEIYSTGDVGLIWHVKLSETIYASCKTVELAVAVKDKLEQMRAESKTEISYE